jgi:dephospho-CoA kinase
MLRIGLTGGLGSGKSTVARMLACHGAYVLSSDEIGRELMEPGKAVFKAIVDSFGPEILAADGRLNRAALAGIVFDRERGRLEELTAIVHPAVIERQQILIDQIAAADPDALVVIESALLLETGHAGPDGWRSRFDCIVLVRAAEELKIARYLRRTLPDASPTEKDVTEQTAEARRRLAEQMPDEEKAKHADYVLLNNGSLADLQSEVDALWPRLAARNAE